MNAHDVQREQAPLMRPAALKKRLMQSARDERIHRERELGSDDAGTYFFITTPYERP